MKQVYKITYPTGKIYIGKDSVGSARYMGSPSMDLINVDFENIPVEQRRSYSIHKEILWESNTASEAELAAKEIEYIRKYGANDPVIGYNRWPKLRTRTTLRRMNRWNIPDSLAREVIERDLCCVYCRVEFAAPGASRRDKPSWEHIINDARIITLENIARCCIGCNASKGTKCLADWLQTEYCRTRRITHESVASVVRAALASNACGP